MWMYDIMNDDTYFLYCVYTFLNCVHIFEVLDRIDLVEELIPKHHPSASPAVGSDTAHSRVV